MVYHDRVHGSGEIWMQLSYISTDQKAENRQETEGQETEGRQKAEDRQTTENLRETGSTASRKEGRTSRCPLLSSDLLSLARFHL